MLSSGFLEYKHEEAGSCEGRSLMGTRGWQAPPPSSDAATGSEWSRGGVDEDGVGFIHFALGSGKSLHHWKGDGLLQRIDRGPSVRVYWGTMQ